MSHPSDLTEELKAGEAVVLKLGIALPVLEKHYSGPAEQETATVADALVRLKRFIDQGKCRREIMARALQERNKAEQIKTSRF